jgi:hypothetical protein
MTITHAQCTRFADDYETLGTDRKISIRRATILMAIATSWRRLASDMVRLADVEAEEEPN